MKKKKDLKQSISLKEAYPELAAQWHPTKNGELTPSDVTPGSRKRVWWYRPYDDPVTGKHFDFEWEAFVYNMTSGRVKCPYLTNRAVWAGYNDLATRNPELAAQWHPTKNGELTPTEVIPGSPKKVWWYLPYDDPVTGKHFDFEWKAGIKDRAAQKEECPYLMNRAVWVGYNDLATRNPELAAQWHPIKNGELTPTDVMPGSTKKVWWHLPYDDPVTGKHFDFEWRTRIVDRTYKKRECPYLANNEVWTGYNDLETRYPELIAQWHPTKNGELTPADVTPGSKRIVWWYLPYDDPITGKHFDFEWKACIHARAIQKAECPFLTNREVWAGYNDLATRYPELAAQWHPTKNGELTPADVVPGSSKRVWWYLPYDDSVTGKHFDFEWEATIYNRTLDKVKCPYLTNDAVWTGYNDLATRYPELAAQWHPTKNKGASPDKVNASGNRWAWWHMPYDDKETGRHFDFEWCAQVSYRIKHPECPFLSKRVWTGYNDLQTCFPEIAAEWDLELNKTKPDKVMKHSGSYAWWRCKCGHKWRTVIASRTRGGTGCPECYILQKRYGIWKD